MNTQDTRGQAVLDTDGHVVVVLLGADAAEAAAWWAEDGYRVVEVDLGASLVAA